MTQLFYRQHPGDVEPAQPWELADLPRLRAALNAAGYDADDESIRQAWAEWSEESLYMTWLSDLADYSDEVLCQRLRLFLKVSVPEFKVGDQVKVERPSAEWLSWEGGDLRLCPDQCEREGQEGCVLDVDDRPRVVDPTVEVGIGGFSYQFRASSLVKLSRSVPVDRLTPGWWWCQKRDGSRRPVELVNVNTGAGWLLYIASNVPNFDGSPSLIRPVVDCHDLTWLGRVNEKPLPPE